MKKSLLALGALAALAGGVAHADVIVNQNSTGASLAVQPDGIGQILTVPYFSTQDNNTTTLNLVNTDTVNGKAVKISFRGARNSDDLFDFYVYLSPGDVWNATVQQNADGFSEIHSTDTSCTVPRKAELYANLNGPQSKFKDLRLPTATKGANETREGYVYFINTADIPPVVNGVTNQLWGAIKHTPTGGSPACGTLVENHHSAAQNITQWSVAQTTGYDFPTTGLFANWLVLNVPKAVVNSGEATAIAAEDPNGNVTAGNFVLFPQVRQAYNYVDPALGTLADTIASRTADPVLRLDPAANSTAQFFDFPDLSTPYVGASTSATRPTEPARPDPTAFGGSTTNAVGLTAVSAGTPSVTYGYVPSGSVAAFQTAANTYVANMVTYQNALAAWQLNPGRRSDAQANELSREFAVKTVVNEYINGYDSYFATDWVLSSPTRRYAVALGQAGAIWENTTSNYWRSTGAGFNSSIANNTIVVNSIEDFSVWNREEVDSDAPVVSPFALPTQPVLPGEASVWRFRDANNVDGSNGGFVLGSDLITQIVRLDNVTPGNVGVGASFNEGWAQFIFNNTVPGSNGRLPVYGYASYSANGAFSIGATFNHRYTR